MDFDEDHDDEYQCYECGDFVDEDSVVVAGVHTYYCDDCADTAMHDRFSEFF